MTAIKILLTLLFVLFPLGQLERIPLANPQIGLYAHDLVIVIILGIWLVRKIKLGRLGKLEKLGSVILAFWWVALVSFLLNFWKRTPAEISIGFLYWLRWGSYAGLYFVIKDLKIVQLFHCSIVSLLIAVGSTATAFGLIQYVFYPDIRPLSAYGWDPHYYRLVGTFLEPGFAGLICVLTMILIINHYWPDKSNRSDKTYWFLLMICYAAMALTYSRATYLAYLIGMGLMAYKKKSLKFFIGVLAVFVFTLLILPRPAGEGVKLERQASAWSRVESWRQGLEIWRQKPIFGVGFNFYRYAARDAGFLKKQSWQLSHAGAGADNSFIFILATTGIFGLFFYTRLLYQIFQFHYRRLKEETNSLIMMTTLGVLLIHGCFNNSLFYPWVMLWFWLLLAATENS